MIALHIALAVVMLLFTTNTFLSGAKKTQIDAFLGFIWLGLVIVGFAFFGWKVGIIALVASFIYGGLLRPVAARIAARLMSIGTPDASNRSYRGLPPTWLASISKELGKQESPQEMMQNLLAGGGKKQAALAALLDRCARDAEIANVLAKHGVETTGLEQVYWNLQAIGAGQWRGGHFVSASTIAYADALDFWLGSRTREGGQLEAAYRLMTHFESGAPLTSDGTELGGLGTTQETAF